MRKHFKRLTAIVLTATMLVSAIPQAVLAGVDDIDTPIYTEEKIQALADAIDVPKGAESGVFSFAAQAYAMRRSESDFSFPVLRGGSCEGEADVALNVADISATYGIDYVLKINGNTLDAQKDAMQLVATEDKHNSESILLTEEYLSDTENEMLEGEGTQPQEENAPVEQSATEDDSEPEAKAEDQQEESPQPQDETVSTEQAATDGDSEPEAKAEDQQEEIPQLRENAVSTEPAESWDNSEPEADAENLLEDESIQSQAEDEPIEIFATEDNIESETVAENKQEESPQLQEDTVPTEPSEYEGNSKLETVAETKQEEENTQPQEENVPTATADSEDNIEPETVAESQQKESIQPQAEVRSVEQPVAEGDTGSVEQNKPEQVNTGEMSLQAMKEELFGRKLSQTDSFYGNSPSGVVFSMSDMEQSLASVLPKEIADLSSVNTVLHFEAGERYKMITVKLLKRGTSAGDESFSLALSQVTKGTMLGEYPSVTVMLEHEGKLEQSRIGISKTIVNSQTGNAEVTVTRKSGEYNAAVVSFTTASGTLESGKDYSPVSETLIFMPGETEKTITISIFSAQGGNFYCMLSNPQGASLSNEKVTIKVKQLLARAVYASNDPLKETHSYKEFGVYSRHNSDMWQADGYYNIQNGWRDRHNDRGNYGIAQLQGKKISGAAYSKVTLNFDSHAEFDGGSIWYNWNDRLANTVFTALWRDVHSPYALDTGWNWNPYNSALSNGAGYFSGWQHKGEYHKYESNLTQSIDIPNNCSGDIFKYTVQQQHIHPWLSKGSVHIKSVELTRRLLRFQYLPHDAFNRRLGSLTNIQRVDNIFQLAPTAGRGQNTTYVIGDTVGYEVKSAAQDKLYEYMTSLARYGVRDSISANATGSNALTLNSNYGFDLNDSFFEQYGKAFAQDGSGSGKVAYIKPEYNKEKWKANLTLEQTPDGTAQLGFIDKNNSIASLSQYPAYLSEEVTLRITPKQGLYAKGYRAEYKDYDGVTRYETHELNESELKGCQGMTKDIRIPVRSSDMKITPIYTSLPVRKITITVDEATRQYGLSFPEGTQEAMLDAQGNRVANLEMGTQITEIATAKTGYVPVWFRNGVRYSGESYDFEIGADDTDICIDLSFERKNAVTHTITGTLREPKININNIISTNLGVDAPKVPLTGAVAAAGLISSESNSDGVFTLNNVCSIAGTRRTVRIVRGGELFIYEVDIPADDSISMGTIDLPLAANLPYKVNGTITYTKVDGKGNMNTYESDFGGIGQDNSNLIRYDASVDDVNGSVKWLGGGNNTYTECELIFSNKEGIEVSRINAQRDVSGDFTFNFNPVLDARAGGGVYLSLSDKNGNVYGPYDTGIEVSDPPNGDIELIEGPSFEVPTKDIELPIVKMTKPNFSTGVFQSGTGLTMVVGFDVKKIASGISDAKKLHNKEAAKKIADNAKEEAAKSTSPKAEKTTGSATASIESLGFGATLSFAYFDKNGKVLAQNEPGAILALYNTLFYIGVSGKAKGEINTSIYGVPVYVELSGGATVAVFVSLSAVDANGKKSHYPMTTFLEDPTELTAEGFAPINLELGLEAGVGRKKIAALYVGGNMDMDFNWYLWDTGTGTVTFDAGGGIYVIGQKIGFTYKFDPIEMFDTTKASNLMVYNQQEPVKVGIDAEQTRHFDFNFSEINSGISNTQEATLLEGVLHDAHPRIADIGDGKTMLVFLADVPDRNGVNRSGLYYSIFDGAMATEPILIDDDGTLDASPNVMDLGNKVLIVWSDTRSDSFGEEADVRDIMSSMDICGAFYDKASKTMGQEFSITSDSKETTNDMFYLYADSQPTICYDEESGNVGVYYIKEDFGTLDTDGDETVNEFMNGQTTAAYCPIDVNEESVSLDYLPEENVPDNFKRALNGQRLLDVGVSSLDNGLSDPKIESFAVDSVDGYTVFAYPMDLDQSGDTMDDQALFVVFVDQATGKRYAPVCLTDTAAAINSLRFVKRQVETEGETVCLDRLVWQSDGDVLCCDVENLLNCVSFGDDGSCVLSEDFETAPYVDLDEDDSTVGNEAMFAAAPKGGVFSVTTGQDGKNSEIFVRYCPNEFTKETLNGKTYLIGQGQWSEAVQITRASNEDAKQHILLKDVATTDDGSLLILCDRFEGVADTGNLQLIRVTPSSALKSDIEITSDKEHPRVGDTVLLTAVVESDGLLDSENVTVDFSLVDKNGTSTPIGLWIGDIPAGGSAQAVTEWTVAEELTEGSKVVASAIQATGELTDLTGEDIVLEDISYRYLSDDQEEGKDKLAVSTAILNRGNKTPQELTLQICSVNRDLFSAELSSEDAYTVLSDTKITKPFENADYMSGEYQITLPPSTDGMPRELMVRVLTKDGEIYDNAVEYISVMPPADNVPLKVNAGEGTGGGTGGNSNRRSGVGSKKGSSYDVTVEKSEHGIVNISGSKASYRNTVTLTVIPDNGYKLNTLTVTDSKGNEIKLTAKDNGKYTFIMPNSAVNVKAAFMPLSEDIEKLCDGGEACPSKNFSDLGGINIWYHEAVDYVLQKGLMNGCGNGLFEPDSNLSRAQLAQILYNKEGKPSVTGDSVFTNVANEQWYTSAISWAAANGIVSGYGNGLFGPDDNITREQLAVMLWRYEGSPAVADRELRFTDADKVEGYAIEALCWAAENNIIIGYGDGRLNPKGFATRAQTAQMLKSFLERE